MSIVCTRCQGWGYLNIEQVPEEYSDQGIEGVQDWLEEIEQRKIALNGCTCHLGHPPCSYCTDCCHDVVICDCCNGEGEHANQGEIYECM